VTSASAAAALAGIPLTRRIHAQRLQFITGADVTAGLPPGLNLAALADPAATTAVFMGKRTFPALAAALVAAGLPPETPALLAEAVGHPGQSLFRSTIAGLAERLAADPGPLPGLILFGPLAGGDAG
jgi:uroporphyrin-III C-methyltransferase